jgi:predicted phage terminase large subunit-like protein
VVLLYHEWTFWARAEQLPPDDPWRVWLILAGRGWGKTRTGAEWLLGTAQAQPGVRLAVVGETLDDARQVMTEGESGILACAPPWFRPVYAPSKRQLSWPNGSMAFLYTADDPEQLRGPQFHAAWCDEVAKWQYPASWDNLQFGLRLGEHPQVVATTTPRPGALLKQILGLSGVVVTKGSTFENRANLPEAFLAEVEGRYGGTRLGRQELYAELLEDTPGALWTGELIERLRVRVPPDLVRIVVGIDPAVSLAGDETGIVVAGKAADGRVYVLDDLSGRYSPDGWARQAVQAFRDWQADRIVAEVNNGGALVLEVLRTVAADVPVKAVHASRGKRARAEPVAALYEQGRVSHVGCFAELEEQMTHYTGSCGEGSPDRLDALVWAVAALMQEASVPEWRIRGM